MTKKGRILVNLGQLEDDPPINGNANLKFLECENAKTNSKRELHACTTRCVSMVCSRKTEAS